MQRSVDLGAAPAEGYLRHQSLLCCAPCQLELLPTRAILRLCPFATAMAQSPIPGISNSQKMSGSPTLGHQPLSKRDKKRQAVENRITNITDSFAQTREAHSRTQLSAITSDIVSIIRANAYANKPLDDTADEAFSDIISLPSAAGSIDGDVARSLPLGKFGQSFVDDVNDAMEERDARITDVDVRIPPGQNPGGRPHADLGSYVSNPRDRL